MLRWNRTKAMVGKTYLRYAAGGDTAVVCSTAALSMECAVLKHDGAPVAVVPALEHVALWNTRTGGLITRLTVGEARRGTTNNVTSVLLRADPSAPFTWLLAAGYASGYVALWRGRGELAWELVFYGMSHKPDTAVLCLDMADAEGESAGLLVTGGQDTDATVWDTATQEPRYRLVGHRGGVVSVALVPGSTRTLVTGAADGLVKIWDLEVQQCVQTIIASDTQVTSLRVDGGGARLLVGLRDNLIKVFSTAACRGGGAVAEDAVKEYGVLQRKTNKPATAIVFSAAQRHVAVVTAHTVELFAVLSADDVRKKIQRKRKRRKEAQAKAGAKTAAAGDEAADEFQPTVAEEIVPLRIYHFDKKIRSVAFVAAKGAPAGAVRLAVCSGNNSLDVYEATRANADGDDDDDDEAAGVLSDLKRQLTIDHIAHQNDIRGLQFASNDAALVSLSSDSVKVWASRNVNVAAPAGFDGDDETPAATIAANRLVCTASIDCAAAEVEASRVLILPGDQLLVIATAQGTLLLASAATQDVVRKITAHTGAVTGLCARSNGAGVVTTGKDRRVIKWDLSVKKKKGDAAAGAGGGQQDVTLVMAEEVELSEAPLFVAVTPNDRLCAVALQDNNIQLFYADSMKPFLNLYGHKLPATGIAFAQDSALCATVGMDKSLRFWGIDFGDCHKAIHAHDEYITDVKFVGSSHYVFTVSLDGTIKHWDGDLWTLIQVVRIHQHGVWALAVNADGTCVATAGADRCVRTLLRTEQMLFPEEEEEAMARQAMDDEAAKRAAMTKLEDVAAEVGVAGRKTATTAEAAETVMEALDQVSVEVQRLEAGGAGQAVPLFANKTVWQYLWSVLEAIKPSEMRHALTSMTTIHVSSLLQYLAQMVDAKVVTSYELAARVLLVMVKPAPGSNVPVPVMFGEDVEGLRLLAGLRTQIAAGLARDADRMATNVAGLKFVKGRVAKLGVVKFDDRSKVQGAKRHFQHGSAIKGDGKREREE
jgi:U3 small nucleolar RNA-associated protein 12